MKKRIQKLAKVISVSGREKELLSLIENEINVEADISYDVMGNLYVRKNGKGKQNILVALSVDAEGFFVNYAAEGEKIRIAPTFPITDYSKIVGLKLEGCGLTGTVRSEKDDDIKLSNIYFEPDNGLNNAKIGDHLSFVSEISEKENFIIGRRAANAALIWSLIDAINNIQCDSTVTAVFAVCGIPGGRGLKTVWHTSKPDRAIVLRSLENINRSPVLLAKDGLVLSDVDMFRKATDTLYKLGIEHSLSAVNDLKRDALSVNLSGIGIPTVSLALPAENIGNDTEKVFSDIPKNMTKAISAVLKINY